MVRHLVINLNIGALRPKMAEVEVMLQQRNPSIVALTETWLLRTDRVFFRGYYIYRDDAVSTRAGGGVALLVRKDIPKRRVEMPPWGDPGPLPSLSRFG